MLLHNPARCEVDPEILGAKLEEGVEKGDCLGRDEGVGACRWAEGVNGSRLHGEDYYGGNRGGEVGGGGRLPEQVSRSVAIAAAH